MESVVSSFMPDSRGQAEAETGSIGWTKELETGVAILDEQHRRYIELLNEYLVKAADKSESVEDKVIKLTESLNFLRRYAQEHFSTEESIMKDAAFPDFEKHLEEHSHFLWHVEGLCTNMETHGFSPALSREVNFYVVDWFIQHILKSDMQLVEFLKIRH